MSGTGTPNYKETHFEFPELTKMGQPTYGSLQKMHNQLKANAQSVYSELGGGAFGHLGMVLSNAQYATISQTPFVKPARPTPPVIPQFAIASVIASLQQDYKKAQQEYDTFNAVKKALRQQIVTAIDETYVIALRNRATNAINLSVIQIMDFLYKTYGRITPQMLDEKEISVKNHVFDPHQPLDVTFNLVEDLMDYATAAGSPYTEMQLMNITYNVINKTGMLKDGIKTWIKIPRGQRSWIQFKQHFYSALQEWSEVTDVTVEESTYRQANFVQQVIDGISNMNANDDETDEAITDMANAMSQQSQTIPQLIAQIQQMQSTMTALQQQMNNSNTNQNTNNRNNQSSDNTSNRKRRNISKYCWSHGACSHTSFECTKRRDGHKEDATSENKKGGSTYYCIPGS